MSTRGAPSRCRAGRSWLPRMLHSSPSRRSQRCWICHRTRRSARSAVAPDTQPWSHEAGSSTPGAGVNTDSWDTGTTSALTRHAASSTWWPRGCGWRRWCVGPGPPMYACGSREGTETHGALPERG